MNKFHHKTFTAAIREAIKSAGVPARVKMDVFCGTPIVSIVTPSYDFRWTEDQARKITDICITSGLRCSQNSDIDRDNMILVLQRTTQQNFEIHRQ